MTVAEVEDIAKEIPILLSSFTTLKEQISDSNLHVKSIIKKVNTGDTDRSEGLSFLEMKMHLVLEYLMNLTYTMLLKIDGRSFDDQPCIKRLVEIRTVLEKIRPINKKLSYQIDKLVKLTTTELAEGELHPLSFKPNLENLASKVGHDDEADANHDEDEGNNHKGKSQDVYVPPKVTAMPYDDNDKLSKKEKKLNKLRQRSMDSTLLQDLRDEYGEAPEEFVSDRGHGMRRAKLKQREEEREQYEEDNLKRLTVTAKDRMLKRKINELDEVIKLGSFHGVGNEGDSDGDDDDGKYKPKKKKKNGKLSSKSKKFKSNKAQKRRK